MIKKPKLNFAVSVNVNKDLLKIKLEKSLDKCKDEFIEMDLKNLNDVKKFKNQVKDLKNDPKRK